MKNFWTKTKDFIKTNRFQIIIILATLIVDQATKIFFDEMLYGKNPFIIINNVFSFTATHNDGAGFSILSGKVWLLIIITVVFLAGIFAFNHFYKKEHKLYKLSMALIISGAIGNLIDRIFLGYVRDFISFDLIHFAIFNFADSCITIGAILLCIFLLFIDKPDKKQEGNKNE